MLDDDEVTMLPKGKKNVEERQEKKQITEKQTLRECCPTCTVTHNSRSSPTAVGAKKNVFFLKTNAPHTHTHNIHTYTHYILDDRQRDEYNFYFRINKKEKRTRTGVKNIFVRNLKRNFCYELARQPAAGSHWSHAILANFYR